MNEAIFCQTMSAIICIISFCVSGDEHLALSGVVNVAFLYFLFEV